VVDIDQHGHAIVLELRRILSQCRHLAVFLCLVRQESAMPDVEEPFRLVGDNDTWLNLAGFGAVRELGTFTGFGIG